jgi:hypothetical protein
MIAGKIILEFDADTQGTEAQMAIDGEKWFFLYNHIIAEFRKREKYSDEELIYSFSDIYEIINDARDYYNLPMEY